MYLHFKTSHVIVYLVFELISYYPKLFQNISCYCLSAIASQRKLLHLDFKTSHVIVYLSAASAVVLNFIFQNISCYCLSFCYSVHNIRTIKFQNISCYCLSEPGTREESIIDISKHLMLLFIKVVKQDDSHILIFQNISCYCLSFCYSVHNIRTITFQNISCYCLSLDREKESIKREHFKTSHVIVYQSKEMSRHGCITISKHLMLLFICASLLYVLRTLVFQNISCYCLSLAFPRFLVSPLPFFPLYFLYFSIFYQPTPLSWTALLIIP